jgi:phosphatidyl-myo-inositol dimannoside synthase
VDQAATASSVLVVTLDFPPRVGGIQILVHRLALSLPKYRAIVVAPSAPGAGAFDAALPFPVIRVRPDPSGSRVRKLVCLLRMLERSVTAAWRTRPRILLCSHVIVAPIGWAIRGLLGVPYVVYVHADELVRLGSLRTRVLRAADHVIADSRYSKDLAVQAGVTSERIAVIGQGADTAPDATPEPGVSPPTILSVARMDELYKGQDVLIRSLPMVRARIPGVRLVLMGEGIFRSYLERLARSLGMSDRVIFTGRVPDAERDRWLSACDVFAMPSRVHALDGAGEGFGIAYLEAGAHGKPALAGRIGGSLDSVVDDVTGLLVDPQSVHEVADGLLRLLTDHDLARRLGEAGRQRVATELSWAQAGRRVEAVFLEVVARSSVGHG